MSFFPFVSPVSWRHVLPGLLLLVASMGLQAADGGTGAHHEALPAYAEEVFGFGHNEKTGGSLISITNSMIMLWLVAGTIILVAQLATRDLKLIPSGLQNFVEWIVESLYKFFEGILGAALTKRTFWFY